jgi:hypothetical protein
MEEVSSSVEAVAASGMSVMEIILLVLGCLFAMSEVLASVSFIKANSVFQLVQNILKALVGSKEEEKK